MVLTLRIGNSRYYSRRYHFPSTLTVVEIRMIYGLCSVVTQSTIEKLTMCYDCQIGPGHDLPILPRAAADHTWPPGKSCETQAEADNALCRDSSPIPTTISSDLV